MRVLSLRSALAALVVLAGLAGLASCVSSRHLAVPGTTYPSLQQLPDFSGWWALPVDFKAGALPIAALFESMPLKPEIRAAMKSKVEEFVKGVDPVDSGTDVRKGECAPPLFGGSNGGLEDAFEFLYTPGRVTIISESGLVRRVTLNQSLPADIQDSNAGTSVGRWERATLVVETVGVGRNASPLLIPLGRNVDVIEHISLKEPDVLQIVTRITAPDLFTTPYESTATFRRDRSYVFHEHSAGDPNDRSIDALTGRQRFDLTPPPGLPPPPKE